MRRFLLGWYLPLLAAVLAGILAALIVAANDPGAEYANQAYGAGVSVGFVSRYVALAALGTWLAQRLARSLAPREGGSRRPGRIAVWGASLTVVLALAIVPPLLGSSAEERRADDFRAGFVDGCSDQQPRTFCTCLYERLNRDPAGDTARELEALIGQAQRTGVAPAALERAAARCARG